MTATPQPANEPTEADESAAVECCQHANYWGLHPANMAPIIARHMAPERAELARLRDEMEVEMSTVGSKMHALKAENQRLRSALEQAAVVPGELSDYLCCLCWANGEFQNTIKHNPDCPLAPQEPQV